MHVQYAHAYVCVFTLSRRLHFMRDFVILDKIYNEICDGTLTLCLQNERHFLLPVNALFGTMKHGQNMRTTVCVCVCVRVQVCVCECSLI